MIGHHGAASAGGQVFMVVDPNYKSHFTLAAKGPEADHYARVLELLPSVFVGTADQLAALVTLLCKEVRGSRGDLIAQARGTRHAARARGVWSRGSLNAPGLQRRACGVRVRVLLRRWKRSSWRAACRCRPGGPRT